MSLRLVFMGTPDFAVPTLAALHEAGHDIAAVYTQPPRPAGRRGLDLTPSPVQREAERLDLPVRTPGTLKDADEQGRFRALDADAAVVVAYGLVLPQAVLDATRLGAFNGHASLLPRWRGAAPIHRAVMAGDRETGVMVMRMEAGLDTGPVALAARTPIGPDETSGDLHDRLKHVTARLLVEAIDRMERGDLPLEPQAVAGMSYARKISKDETRIDWTLDAGELHNRVRGLSPAPGAWCEMAVGERRERLKLLRATVADGRGLPGEILDNDFTVACGTGAVRLLEVQRAGGRPSDGPAFMSGARLKAGMVLT